MKGGDVNMSRETDLQLVQKAVDDLGEHFDTVQIFVTRYEGGDGTTNINLGTGNWFARFGHVSEWLLKEIKVVLPPVSQ